MWKRFIQWLQRRARPPRPRLQIFCDGSGDALPGKSGGWAFVIVRDEQALLTGSGGARSTTSTRMELQAGLAGLEAVLSRGWHHGAWVELVSDCRLAVDVAGGATRPLNDSGLAAALRAACLQAGAHSRWVRGHAGNPWNERVDLLAQEARQRALPARVLRKRERRRSTVS